VKQHAWSPTAIVALLVAANAIILGSVPASGTEHASRLPPANRDAIARIFDPGLRPLGLRVTRAGLQAAHTYAPDSRGDHLAIYVEPTGAYSPSDYLDNVSRVARIFLPKVFNRWKGLRTFDVCQEPLPALDDRAEPSPVTQLAVSRRGAAQIRWQRADLADLVAIGEGRADGTRVSRRDYSLYIQPELHGEPAYQRASSHSSTSQGD
jgi:hypothetical protein